MNASIIETNKAAVARFLDGTHSGDLDVIDSTVAEDIVTHGFPGGVDPTDRETYKQFFRDFGASFSDMEFRALATVADTGTVAVRFEVQVTHTGPFAGVPATGKRIRFTGVGLYTMRDGLIAETHLHVDELGMLAQLGLIGNAAAA